MKAFYTILFTGLIIIFIFVGATTGLFGNRDLIDTVFRYDYGIVRLADGTIVEGTVNKWRDYEGDQIQVTIDGETWLVHSANVSLHAQ